MYKNCENPTPMLIPFYTRPISKYKLSVIFFTDKMVAEFAGRAPPPLLVLQLGVLMVVWVLSVTDYTTTSHQHDHKNRFNDNKGPFKYPVIT